MSALSSPPPDWAIVGVVYPGLISSCHKQRLPGTQAQPSGKFGYKEVL